MTHHRVPYREFCQQVRRFHRDQLLEKIASVSAELEAVLALGKFDRWGSKSPVKQFSLALIARTAILQGTTQRPEKPVSDRQIHELCAVAIDVDHPEIPHNGLIEDRALSRMFARITYSQGPFRRSNFENIARSMGLLVDHDPGVRGLPSQEDWEGVLGVPLPAYMATCFNLAGSTFRQHGRLSGATIRAFADRGAFAGLDAEAVMNVIETTSLSADLATMQADGRRAEISEARMWSFNPLMATPLIARGNHYLLPIHDYLVQKITPLGLYFAGRNYFGGDDFSRALGDSFEKYVGQHLALLQNAGAEVYPEITYGRQNKRTVDYFVVFPELVLLVEVKGARPTENARAGVDAGLDDIVKKVQRARNQIDATAKLIGDRVPNWGTSLPIARCEVWS